MSPINRKGALERIEGAINEISTSEVAMQNSKMVYNYLSSVGDRTGNSIYSLGLFYLKYLLPYLNEHNLTVESMDKKALNDFAINKLSGLNPNTARQYIVRTLSLVNWYRGISDLPTIPLKYIVIPRRPEDPAGALRRSNKVVDYLTDEQIERIMELIKGREVRLAAFLMNKLGLRISEALGIKIMDVMGNPKSAEPGLPAIQIKWRDGEYGAKGPKGDRIDQCLKFI